MDAERDRGARHDHRRLGRRLLRRHVPRVRPGGRGEAADHGAVDARAAASVPRGALGLGGRDGGLVGRVHGAGRSRGDRGRRAAARALFSPSGGGVAGGAAVAAARREHRRLFPAGHRLAAEPPAEASSRAYRGDPLVGLAAGIWDPFGTGSGWPEEQSGDDARSLAFTSDPLPEPLLIAGRPRPTCRDRLPADDETEPGRAGVAWSAPTSGRRSSPPAGSASARRGRCGPRRARMITVLAGRGRLRGSRRVAAALCRWRARTSRTSGRPRPTRS